MGLVKRLAAKMGYYPQGNIKNQVLFRQFLAGQISRLTESWTTTATSLDYDLKRSLRIMQARSRDLFQNEPYAKKFMIMAKTNVVGPTGFALQVKITESTANGKVTLDKLAGTAIEKSFKKWCKPGNCDVTGKMSFLDIQNLFLSGQIREGEVLIRKITGKNAGEFGFMLQVLDIDRLDTEYNYSSEGGNEIRMGVEVNSFGKPIAYHLKAKHPGDSNYYTYKGGGYIRIPANEIIHQFVLDRPEQTRGIPALHAAMFKMQNLGKYEEAAVIAARIGAAKMGFYTSPDGDGSMVASEETNDGELRTEAEPGQFDVLPEGYKFESFNPDYPHSMFDSFMKTCLRGIASGMGVAYNELANDLEGVNFSSMRSGALSERDHWMVWQNWVIEHFLEPIYSEWLRMALLMGAITLPNGNALPLAKYEKFNVGAWQGRRWQWVDPRADTESNVQQVNKGLKSRAAVIAEQGRDIDDVWLELSEEKKRAQELGISEILLDASIQNNFPKQEVNQDS